MRSYVNELALAEACAASRPPYEPLDALLKARYQHRALTDALFCARGMLGTEVRPGLRLCDLGRSLPPERRRLLFLWTDKKGPFIDDDRQLIDQDLFLFGADEVTDLGLGEAARRMIFSFSTAVLSPVHSKTSRFFSDFLEVVHGLPDEPLARIPVPNYLNATKLSEAIEAESPEPTTWTELLTQARQCFDHLCIGEHCDQILARQTYRQHQGRRIRELLSVLQRVKAEMGEDGKLSAEGHNLCNQFFVGERAWFSDESKTRKRSPDLFTFPNPSGRGTLTCFWHGKISSDAFRLYFDWPVSDPGIRLRVAYIGPHL